MSERQPIKCAAPSGKEFEIKPYLTARERNELRSVFLQNISIDPSTNQPKVGELAGSLLEHAERKMLELALVSYDGSAEQIIERILDGSPEDYDFIVTEANKIGNFKLPK